VSDPIDPDKLLAQARELAGFTAGPGHPRTIDHRRAVSAAYYTLFHELIARSAAKIFPDASADDCLKIRRWYDHGEVKKVCERLSLCAAATVPRASPPGGVPEGFWQLFSRPSGTGRKSAVPANLVTVADAFVRLIEARHRADYDHEASFPRATTKSYVLEAEDAIRKVRQLVKSSYGRKFLALLLVTQRNR
jgi:hypothetical protein